jgi:hypothetical protein
LNCLRNIFCIANDTPSQPSLPAFGDHLTAAQSVVEILDRKTDSQVSDSLEATGLGNDLEVIRAFREVVGSIAGKPLTPSGSLTKSSLVMPTDG